MVNYAKTWKLMFQLPRFYVVLLGFYSSVTISVQVLEPTVLLYLFLTARTRLMSLLCRLPVSREDGATSVEKFPVWFVTEPVVL